MGLLAGIISLAAKERIVIVDYMPRNSEEQTRRWIEPYQLQLYEEAEMVLCWQVKPETGERQSWRTFRVDRMVAVYDSGETFKPRMDITIGSGYAPAYEWGDDRPASLSAVNRYFTAIELAMRDGKIDIADANELYDLGRVLSRAQLGGAHAQTFANVLRDCLRDGEISEAERIHLMKVRRMLTRLGWAPGDATTKGVFQ